MQIAGIDYGKKLNGTTVLCSYDEQNVQWYAAAKQQDADQFLKDQIAALQPRKLFIDAPLSLPGIYWLGKPCTDYFYREADKAVKGMSPMFLGALTARAIKFKDAMVELGISCYEAYPAGLAKEWQLKALGYKGTKEHIKPVSQQIQNQTGISVNPENLKDWHHVDALLALCSGLRYEKNQHVTFGNPEEGEVIV